MIGSTNSPPPLATVARTGSYTDLSNKPTIPPALKIDVLFDSTNYHELYNEQYHLYHPVDNYQWVVIRFNRHGGWGYDVRTYPVYLLNTLGNIQVNSSDAGTSIYCGFRIDTDTDILYMFDANWMTITHVWGL